MSNTLTLARAVESRAVRADAIQPDPLARDWHLTAGEAECVAPALYSINVHKRHDLGGELVGKYGVVSPKLSRNRAVALQAALRDAERDGVELDIADLETREEYR